MSDTDNSSAPQAPITEDTPQTVEGLTKLPDDAVVHLSREDVLLVENSQLKLALSQSAVTDARRAYQSEVQRNAELTARFSQKYQIDATRYLFNPQNGTLVLRKPQPVPPPTE